MKYKLDNIKYRVGIYDHIVSGGGVRVFTTRLLEALSKAGGDRYIFHLMWPLYDSSNNYLIPPAIDKNVSFDRITIMQSDRLVSQILDSASDYWLSHKNSRITKYATRKIMSRERSLLRRGDRPGLNWLNSQVNKLNLDLVYMPYTFLTLPERNEWSLDVPIVATFHDLAHEHTNAWGSLQNQLKKESLRWGTVADKLIFSSNYIKDEAIRIYNFNADKTKTIYLAPFEKMKSVDTSTFRGQFGNRYLFSLGWAAPHKNATLIVKAFSLHKDKFPDSDLTLVLAGPGTSDMSLHEYSNLILGENIHLLGYIADHEVADLYAGAFGVVTASKSEAGFNALMFDAMMFGVPVLCSNIPQFNERIVDNDIALTFDPDSAESLVSAIQALIEDDTARTARTIKAKKYIDTRTWDDVGEEYLSIFEEALNNHNKK